MTHVNQMTIDGKPVSSTEHFDVYNPSTGEVFDQAPSASLEQVDDAMTSADDAFRSWKLDDAFRVSKLQELAKAMMDNSAEIASDLAIENGKTAQLAGFEPAVAAGWLQYYAGLELPSEVLRDDDEAFVKVEHRPMGVVGAITPWNMPVALAFWKIAPALRAGNTVVLKPSPFTPFSSLRFGQIAADILPPGVLNVVSGGNEVGAAMTAHPTPRKISFTGSTASGKKVAIAAAADLKRVTLELGGNDPAIILDDVDVDAIAQQLFWGAFFNTGQGCVLVKRIYAHERIHDQLVEALAAIAKTTSVGDPVQMKDAALGPLATKFQAERIAELTADAVANGARVASGGKRLDSAGYFFEPTILYGLDNGTRIVDEEQFGPSLPIMSYTNLDDAIVRANSTTFGLSASVWSSDEERAMGVASQIDAGTTWINTHAILPPDVPFGGRKWSGVGVENGPAGLLSFMDVQVMHAARGAVGAPGVA